MNNLIVIVFHERDVIMRSCDGAFIIYRPLVHNPDVKYKKGLKSWWSGYCDAGGGRICCLAG